jgi:DEAD/DEAH box helicase domain-containing protein
VRILLPVTDLTDEKSVESIIAAIFLGLKKKFGNIDHISSTLVSVPTENSSDRRSYLVLYDLIPGGTGYLKQLMTNPIEMIDVMQRSLDTMRSCSCNTTEKDGCYRCLLAYRQSKKMNKISRDTAIDIFSKLTSSKDSIKKVSSLGEITFNKLYDSELEMKFIESLRSSKALISGDAIRLKKYLNTPGGNPGWYMEVGKNHYIIEPQVSIGLHGKLTHHSKPDFVIYPRNVKQNSVSIKPIAIFTDGYQFHKDIIHTDMAKRMSIVQDGQHYVWSITWDDLHKEELNLKYKKGRQVPKLSQVLSNLGLEDNSKIDQNNSFSVLLYLLENYQVETFVKYAFGLTLALSAQREEKDYSSLLHFWRDQSLETQFSTITGNSAIAMSSSYSHDSHVFLQHFSFIQKEAFSKQEFRELYSYLVFDDMHEFQKKEDAVNTWHTFLYLYNMLQFLPNTKSMTKRGLAQSIFWGIPFADFEKPVQRSPGLSELMEITDHEYDHILADLDEDMLPEAYFELENNYGGCIGQADLAWPQYRCVLIDADQQEPWVQAGWNILLPSENPETIIETLKEYR